MKPEEQRIAIAEACGWQGPHHPKNVEGMAGWWSQEHGVWWVNPEGKRVMVSSVPDYLNSLDAMHEAEKVLTGTLRQNLYQSEIAEICWADESRSNNQVVFNQLTATATQRAEAFLRALNLWSDEI
jgi:hypothetical protein